MNKELYKNKYRVKSARLENYDYSQNGFYFITICTKDRELLFGNVKNNEMILNNIGNIVAGEWKKTEIIRKNVFLDEWIVMPNHIHGILIIDSGVENPVNANKQMNGGRDAPAGRLYGGNATNNNTPTVDGISINNDNIVDNKNICDGINVRGNGIVRGRDAPPGRLYGGKSVAVNLQTNVNKSKWKSGTLGSIVNQFKSTCTKQIRNNINSNFVWQSRFYDHIIRNEKSLNRIRQYIMDNPQKWEQDRNNVENLWM